MVPKIIRRIVFQNENDLNYEEMHHKIFDKLEHEPWEKQVVSMINDGQAANIDYGASLRRMKAIAVLKSLCQVS